MVRVLLGPRARKALDTFRERASFSKPDRMLMDAILERVEWLRKDTHVGVPVGKKYIPKGYKKHDITTLFLLKLPLFWRLLYTIRHDDGKFVAILDILSHAEYDALFGYRKK